MKAKVMSLSGSAAKFLADGAKAWNLSKGTLIALMSVPFIVALAGVAAALLGKDVYKWFTGEDRFAETLQVLFYTLGLVLSLLVARHHWRTGRKWIGLAYLGASFALFFLIGEELSWGQRVFRWQTPEAFQQGNKQEETNLHNIYGVGDTFKWIQLLVGAYGAILPLAALRSSTLKRYREEASWLIPHYTLVPYFLMMFLWRIYRNLWEEPDRFYLVVADYNEVMELSLAIGIFLFMVFQIRRIRARQTAAVPTRTAAFDLN